MCNRSTKISNLVQISHHRNKHRSTINTIYYSFHKIHNSNSYWWEVRVRVRVSMGCWVGGFRRKGEHFKAVKLREIRANIRSRRNHSEPDLTRCCSRPHQITNLNRTTPTRRLTIYWRGAVKNWDRIRQLFQNWLTVILKMMMKSSSPVTKPL